MRQIVLDTETTGLEPSQGHRIIEIGCVELINRRLTGNRYHQYLQPDREIDEGAFSVHGISNESLKDKPRFAEITDEFVEFIRGAELIIHNAPFDVGFLNAEFKRLKKKKQTIDKLCTVMDTLVLARQLHPGQKNNLDALCKRYDINNAHRELHGALLDAEILADVYLFMTGGQSSLILDAEVTDSPLVKNEVKRINSERGKIRVIRAQDAEKELHQTVIERLNSQRDDECLWSRLEAASSD